MSFNVDKKLEFIRNYTAAQNAADGSKFDANANVSTKNVATMSSELFKEETIILNRRRMTDRITEMYGKEMADEYLRQLTTHEIYKHDETSCFPYCVSISMYPMLLDGLTKVGGSSRAPRNTKAFIGEFINLAFLVAAQFAGAVATPEFLMYLDYFLRRDYGDDYTTHLSDVVEHSREGRTLQRVIEDYFQQVVYSLNQPAAARGNQALFWNVAYFDRFYFDQLFGEFYFPDATQPIWESVSTLQKLFMKWFNNERLIAELTFPVETLSLLTDEEGHYADEEWFDFACEMLSEGHSFFIYRSNTVDSLASCCRLRNEMQDNTFSFSLGAGGVMTGSMSVITMNLNRIIQQAVKDDKNYLEEIRGCVRKVHKYQKAFRANMKEFLNGGMLTIYDADFIDMDKQFLTLGISGLIEAAEFLGYTISNNDAYLAFMDEVLTLIKDENKAAREPGIMYNTEFVPGENLNHKNAKWDRADGYVVPRDVYTSYFYCPEDTKIDVFDKLTLHGTKTTRNLDGGVAAHINLDEHLSKKQYEYVLNYAAKVGCSYFTFNIPNTVCNECGHITKHNMKTCPNCGSEDVDYLTRIIWYLKRVSNFSKARREEAKTRFYDTLR